MNRSSAFHPALPRPKIEDPPLETELTHPYRPESLLMNRRPPDTPQRKPMSRELEVRKLLLSSTKKPGLPTPNEIEQRKRYKDALDTSPVRFSTGSMIQSESEDDFDDDDDSDLDDEILPDEEIPRIECGRLLGNGEFGVVYLARYKNRDYALKEKRKLLTSPANRESTLNDLKLWDSLRHHRIVTFYRAWQEECRLYILMRFCDGGNLKQYVENHQRISTELDEKSFLFAFRDCCLALEYIHTKGCVHMDVKPSNICIRKGRVLLGDMDLLVRQGELPKESDYTYSAHECLFLEYRALPSADIFSLGLSFLELASLANLPRNGDPRWSELRKSGFPIEYFPRLRKYPKLEKIISKCTLFDYEKRPQARELLAEPYFCDPSLSPAKISLNTYQFPDPDRRNNRPDSATLISPRNSSLSFGFIDKASSPIKPLAVSRGSSLCASPPLANFLNAGRGRFLDFHSATPSPSVNVEFALDESALSDRFSTQAVVSPTPKSNVNSREASRASSPQLKSRDVSRASSPRFPTSSPVFLFNVITPDASKPPRVHSPD